MCKRILAQQTNPNNGVPFFKIGTIGGNPDAYISLDLFNKNIVYRDVTGSDIVIIGGYGVGKENFQLIYELADKLDAAVGATRKAVDEGWAPFEIQIGQTGKIIAADVCICFGVSGSLQHTIGIKSARKIIAVNLDPTAQIFSISDIAILADCKTVIESMLEKIPN